MASPQISTAVGKYRWVVCALLFFATTVIYIDRQILSLIKPILDEQLKWTNEDFGLVNAAFQGAYGISLLAFGWFVDRFGTKIGYAVTITAWAIAACAHALVGSVGGFLAARLSLGLGEGGNFPSAIKAVALWFPRHERALATTIFNSGANVGAIIAPAIVPAIAYNWGWHWAYIFAGVGGFIWLAFWLPYYNVPEKSTRVSAAEVAYIESDNDATHGEKPRVSWWYLLTLRQTWAFIIAKFMTDPVWWFFLIWLPDYFHKTRGLEFKPAPGTSFSIPLPLVAIYTVVTVLSIAGGWFTGYLKRSGSSSTRARKIGMALFAVLVVPILAVTQVGEWPAIFLIGLAGAAHQAWSATIFTTVSDVFPKFAVGSVIGIGGLAGGVGGMLFPVFCGKILDHFTKLGDVAAGYKILFAICASAYVVTFVIHHLLVPKLEPIEVKYT